MQNIKFKALRTAEKHSPAKDYEWIFYRLHMCLQILSQNMK